MSRLDGEEMPLVVVKWVDAMSHHRISLESLREAVAMPAETAGFLVAYDTDKLSLAGTIFEDEEVLQALTIPTSCVIDVTPMAPGTWKGLSKLKPKETS